MKKIIIILSVLVPVAVAAQNRAIEELAAKYADREGFSTTVIKGVLSGGASGAVKIEGVDISKIVKDISSITIVSSDGPDDEFSRDVKSAVQRGGYSTVMSSSSDGERIEFLLSDVPPGGDGKKRNEFVITILGRDENLIVSIVGNYSLGKVAKTDE